MTQSSVLQGKIVAALKAKPGSKASQLAAVLGTEKHEINSVLYKLIGSKSVRKTPDLKWYIRESRSLAPGPQAASGTPIREEPPSGNAVNVPVAVAHTFSPTGEQSLVIHAGPSTRLLIEAGPGTGKTETLVARLQYLTCVAGLSAANILVLSFSVSAVRELKRRIEVSGDKARSALRFVEIRTFDSFASRFLRQLLGAEAIRDKNYEERIVLAGSEIASNAGAARLLGDYRHVLIDEVQDLVGARADMAFELLKRLGSGFTLFGDSAQGIYDFQLRSGQSKTKSEDLIKKTRKEFPDVAKALHFTTNFRVGGNKGMQRIAMEGRRLLLESPSKAQVFLEGEFCSLSSQGSTGAPKIDAGFLNESTCVVCQTNGQVLRLAGELLEKDIPFQIVPEKSEYLTPPWIGVAFFGWPDDRVRRLDFMAKVRGLWNLTDEAAAGLWSDLATVIGVPKSASFEMKDLRASLTDGTVIPEVQPPGRSSAGIQLSTIHRAKGREFANVIIVHSIREDVDEGGRENARKEEVEPRVLFVALTRARRNLRKMMARSKGVWKMDGRWIRTFPRKKDFIMLSSFQVGLHGDIDAGSFAAGPIEDARIRQAFIMENAGEGVAVSLRLSGQIGAYPRYKICLEGVDLGSMSVNFGRAVWETLKGLNKFTPTKFPGAITGIWIRGVRTSVGDQSAEEVDRSLRTSALWVTPVLEGLGHCEWN